MANDDLQTKLIKTRVKMLMSYPFFGNVSMHLPFVELDEIETAGTDGRCIYYSPKFIEKLKDSELLFLICHEVLHVVFQHMKRREDRNVKKFNVACDYVINAHLINDNVGTFIEGGCHDQQWLNEVAEYVYDQLPDHPLYEPTDCHISFDENGDATITTASGKQFKCDKIKPLTPDQMKELSKEMQTKVIQAMQQCAGKNNSENIRRLVGEMLEPKIDWRSYLCQQISYQVKEDFSFSRRSRKSADTDFILPGLTDGYTVELTCALDMSGSIGQDMIVEFLTEVRSIVASYRTFKMTIMCFDTQMLNVKTFTQDNVYDLERYEPTGGGGTDFMAVWNYLKENNMDTKQLVVFTDGYPGGEWGVEGFCETLFLISGNNSIKAPFGITINY